MKIILLKLNNFFVKIFSIAFSIIVPTWKWVLISRKVNINNQSQIIFNKKNKKFLWYIFVQKLYTLYL